MVRGSVDDGVGLLLLGNFCSLPTLKNHPQILINTGQNGSAWCPPLKETLARFLGDISDHLTEYLSKLLIIIFAEAERYFRWLSVPMCITPLSSPV